MIIKKKSALKDLLRNLFSVFYLRQRDVSFNFNFVLQNGQFWRIVFQILNLDRISHCFDAHSKLRNSRFPSMFCVLIQNNTEGGGGGGGLPRYNFPLNKTSWKHLNTKKFPAGAHFVIPSVNFLIKTVNIWWGRGWVNLLSTPEGGGGGTATYRLYRYVPLWSLISWSRFESRLGKPEIATPKYKKFKSVLF